MFGKALRPSFGFAADYHPLNHGSYGACPKAVLAVQQRWRDEVEARPDVAIRSTYPRELQDVRAGVASWVGCEPRDLVLVPNATTGTNTVLQSLPLKAGDRILYFSTSYIALQKTVLYVCARTGAQPVVVDVPHPLERDVLLQRTEAALQAGGVRVAVIDTVSSMPALRMPFAELTALCKQHGSLTLVDGAHGVGCVDLNLRAWQPDFFVSNLHKWGHCTRPNALLYVNRAQQKHIHAHPISHGYKTPGVESALPVADQVSQFENEFAFVGTTDVSGVLSIPAAQAFRAQLGGEQAIRSYVHTLATDGAAYVAAQLGTEVMTNCEPGHVPMMNVRLPLQTPEANMVQVRDALQEHLCTAHKTFIPVLYYGKAWWARLSAQVYLDQDDFVFAADALKQSCKHVA